jgi:hypothetical protein
VKGNFNFHVFKLVIKHTKFQNPYWMQATLHEFNYTELIFSVCCTLMMPIYPDDRWQTAFWKARTQENIYWIFTKYYQRLND